MREGGALALHAPNSVPKDHPVIRQMRNQPPEATDRQQDDQEVAVPQSLNLLMENFSHRLKKRNRRLPVVMAWVPTDVLTLRSLIGPVLCSEPRMVPGGAGYVSTAL